MYRRTRFNYWSSSKLSQWLRTKAGLENPLALTWEGWEEHHERSRQKAPIIDWITDKGFNRVQDVVYFVPDIWWSIKTANVWKYLRNLYVFHKALWNYRSWDYSGMLEFMETCAKDMSDCHKNHGHLLRSEETAKELFVLSEILKRVRLDNYTEDKIEWVDKKGNWGELVQKPNTLPNYNSHRTFYKLTQLQRKHDLELATKMINRKLFYWWD